MINEWCGVSNVFLRVNIPWAGRTEQGYKYQDLDLVVVMSFIAIMVCFGWCASNRYDVDIR